MYYNIKFILKTFSERRNNLLSKLKIKLDINSGDIGYNSGSLFQGVLMEKIDMEFGLKLHNLPTNPYSQFIRRSIEGTFWQISTTNKEAYEKVLLPLMHLDKVFLKNKNMELKILEKTLETVSREEFIEENLFEKEDNSRIIFNFVTPTAFKRDNRYIIIPEPGLIFQNLIRKFDASGKEQLFSYELLNEINNSVFISKYKLRSNLFNLEKTQIPAFTGSLEINAQTNREIKNILNLLCAFSNFSGTGIKCSMGMGGTFTGGEKLG